MSRILIGETELNVVQRGTGRPLLLVHGFPLDHQMWKGQIDEFGEDFHVIAPDLRGFGQSDCRGSTVLMEDFADDMAQLLETLGIDQKVILCGLSMGGYIAWQFWRRHGGRLSHLILCDTRALPDTPEASATRHETAERVLGEGPKCLVDTMIPKLFSERTRLRNPSVVAAMARVIESAQPAGVAAALRGMAQRKDVTTWLSEIDVSVLALCGQQDAISGVAEMQEFVASIPGAEFAVVPDCGHMAPLEQPERVNKILRDFLNTTHKE